MLPVVTPPNAIVFGSGYVTIPQTVKSGFGLNILGIIITVAITFTIVIPLFGIELGVIPDWATASINNEHLLIQIQFSFRLETVLSGIKLSLFIC